MGVLYQAELTCFEICITNPSPGTISATFSPLWIGSRVADGDGEDRWSKINIFQLMTL
jgi:hypothetical protein